MATKNELITHISRISGTWNLLKQSVLFEKAKKVHQCVENEHYLRGHPIRFGQNLTIYGKNGNLRPYRRTVHSIRRFSSQTGAETFGVTATKPHGEVEEQFFQLMNDPSVQSEEVFAFIIENIERGIPGNGIEVFLFRLIQEENHKAAGSLLLAITHLGKIHLSNQLWGVYLSCVCDNTCYVGALVIYHELIDPKKSYGDSPVRDYNPFVPFLITPNALESLAIIFQINGDPARLEGILAYFKRFYSYLHHRNVYKTLKITLVESYSQVGDTENALKAFKDLCFCFVGEAYSRKRPEEIKALNIFSSNNFKWRRNNVKLNNKLQNESAQLNGTSIDRIQKAAVLETGSSIYDPVIEYNVYSSPGSKQLPILDRSIQTNDLPIFCSLIRKNLESIERFSSSELVNSFLNSIKKCHYMLHLILVTNLSDLGLVREAFDLIIKLPNNYPNMKPQEVVKHENFIHIFKSCKEQLLNAKHNNKTDELYQLSKLCIDVKDYFLKLHDYDTAISQTVFRYFISALLSSPVTNKDQIMSHVNEYLETGQRKHRKCILLDEDDFSVFDSLVNIKQPNVSRYASIVKKRAY